MDVPQYRRSLVPSFGFEDPGLTVPGNVPASSVRSWRVLHACDEIDPACIIAELQRTAGMRPLVVTPQGPMPLERLNFSNGAQSKSLLNAWNEVRQWRRVLLETDPGFESEIVHAHSFSSGMAAVRNCPTVVYQISHFVEDLGAGTHVPADSGHWMSRSFRVAEQFVITRAAAIVVPFSSVRDEVIQRGALPENVFVVPPVDDFVDPAYLVQCFDRVYRHAFARRRSGNLQTPAVRLEPAPAS